MDTAPLSPARPRKPSTRRKRKLKEARVRMYRVGFGDCFLLTFVPTSGDPHTMLIDFGVYQATKGAGERMNTIARDIRQATHNHIDTVVATHEHADHLSGFKQAAGELNQLSIDALWLGWTSDRSDPDGKRRNDKAAKICLAANAAVLRMPTEQAARIQSVLDFGPNSPENCSSSPLWANLTNFKQSVFLEPDDVIDLPELGVKIYVLAPSRQIFQPGRRAASGAGGVSGAGGSALALNQAAVGSALALNQATSFLAAAVNAAGLAPEVCQAGELSAGDLKELFRLSLPFDPHRGVPLADAQAYCAAQAVQQSAPSAPPGSSSSSSSTPSSSSGSPDSKPAAYEGLAFYQHFYEDAPDWRRIDYDWLNLAEALALSIDNSVNNTSLVLAIELVESGKVLLFPGDAQLESWETWKNASADLTDLFKRTVLYKVGHHGSHNATWKDENHGINLMTNPELVALLPLDEAMARDTIGWDMPDSEVWRLVNEKTNGRVLRIDISKEDHTIPPRPAGASEEDWKSLFFKKPAGWTDEDWKAKFLKNVSVDTQSGQALWFEYRIAG